MLVAGLRRLAGLVLIMLGVALVLALIGALLLHAPLRRSLSVSCYCLGGFLLVAGFFHGVRPPIRVEEDAGVMSMFGLMLTKGRMRTASMDERHEALSSSALLVTLAVILILVGGLIDPVHRLL
jgi:hypothetical protein